MHKKIKQSVTAAGQDVKPIVIPSSQTITSLLIEWTANRPSVASVSHYDHTMLMSPIGDFIIEWKSWKEQPSYSITLKDNEYIGCEYSLDEAKDKVSEYLINKRDELIKFLSKTVLPITENINYE